MFNNNMWMVQCCGNLFDSLSASGDRIYSLLSLTINH